MHVDAGIKAQPQTRQRERSMFAILFTMAYDRIWKDLSINLWNWLFWVPILIVAGFHIYGYSSRLVDSPMFWLSWLFVQLGPIFIIPAWINMVHVSTANLDDSLRTIPMRPSEIIVPRAIAVLITSLEIFAPAIIALLICRETANNSFNTDGPGVGDVFYGVLLILSWIFFLIAWGFAAGSISVRRRGNFFLWFFSPGIAVLLIVIPLIIGGVIENFYDIISFGDRVFSRLYEVIGIIGLILSPVLVRYACRKWGERTG